ncbi:uncharacterized protein V1516DRAFT_143210 [Lipomyces oligophaga]|uniref:uncharacterized protein n=1 Tax=Lipomyces oligophaga TaxID=45792 RepID=UPI0034CD07A8
MTIYFFDSLGFLEIWISRILLTVAFIFMGPSAVLLAYDLAIYLWRCFNYALTDIMRISSRNMISADSGSMGLANSVDLADPTDSADPASPANLPDVGHSTPIGTRSSADHKFKENQMSSSISKRPSIIRGRSQSSASSFCSPQVGLSTGSLKSTSKNDYIVVDNSLEVEML